MDQACTLTETQAKKKRVRILKEKFYKRITHDQRLNVIYGKYVHGASLKELASENHLNYNSVRNILNQYRKTGRTNKKEFQDGRKSRKTVRKLE